MSIFAGAASLALIVYLIFGPDIDRVTKQSPIIIDLMYILSFYIGLIYGIKMTDRVMEPSGSRSPLKRSIFKTFLFLVMMGAIFTSVSFALHGGAHAPHKSLFTDGLIPWLTEFIQGNGGLSFLLFLSITIMGAATRRILWMARFLRKFFSFLGTYIFFLMITLNFTHSVPAHL